VRILQQLYPKGPIGLVSEPYDPSKNQTSITGQTTSEGSSYDAYLRRKRTELPAPPKVVRIEFVNGRRVLIWSDGKKR
jgi:hypothetical protein